MEHLSNICEQLARLHDVPTSLDDAPLSAPAIHSRCSPQHSVRAEPYKLNPLTQHLPQHFAYGVHANSPTTTRAQSSRDATLAMVRARPRRGYTLKNSLAR
eukprot:2785722-Pleurochrysis_carterae.AAC.1